MKKNIIVHAFLVTNLIVISILFLNFLYAFLVSKGVKLPDYHKWDIGVLTTFLITGIANLFLYKKVAFSWRATFKKIEILVLLPYVALTILTFFIIQPLVDPLETYNNVREKVWCTTIINFEVIREIGVIGFISMGFLIPIMEELLFRGIFLNQFLKKYPVAKSLVWSSVIFAVWHITSKPFAMLYLFIFGLLFGFSYYKSRTLLLPILLHVSLNLIAMLTVDEFVTLTSPVFNRLLMQFLICAGVIGFLFVLLNKVGTNKNKPVNIKQEE